MHVLQKISLVIVIIGALNWGLIGIFDFNLVAFIFDSISTVISRIIYALVGVAGVICISTTFYKPVSFSCVPQLKRPYM